MPRGALPGKEPGPGKPSVQQAAVQRAAWGWEARGRKAVSEGQNSGLTWGDGCVRHKAHVLPLLLPSPSCCGSCDSSAVLIKWGEHPSNNNSHTSNSS